MNPADLERDIDEALRALPAPVAPSSLVGRVMRQARVTPAGGLRPWFAWDPRLQVAAAVVFMAAVSAIAWFSGDIVAAAQSLNSWTVVEAARAVWRVAEPVVAGGSVYVVVMGVVVACVAAALGQVALEGTSKS